MTPDTSTVLLADDDHDDVLLVRRALASAGWAGPVQDVSDGQDLLDYLLRHGRWSELPERSRPALVLLDLNMPRMDGLSALTHLRALPEFSDLPVVVLTTSSSPFDRDKAMALGANGYVSKPSSFAGLVEAMRSARGTWLS